jgi:hypothetical protein
MACSGTALPITHLKNIGVDSPEAIWFLGTGEQNNSQHASILIHWHESFMYSHKKKSQGVKSGKRRGQARTSTTNPVNVCQFKDKSSRCSKRAVKDRTGGCEQINQVSYVRNGWDFDPCWLNISFKISEWITIRSLADVSWDTCASSDWKG